MRSAAQRIAAYNARTQSSQIDPTLTAMNAQQQANYAGYVADWYPKQVLLRDWLNLSGFGSTVVFKYEALAGECYAVDVRFAGPTAIAYAAALKVKYTALGLNGVDISAMLLAVFGWIVP